MYRSVLILLIALPAMAAAQPLTQAFTYQGELTDDGSPAEGLYDLEFQLYDQSSSGLPLNVLMLENVEVNEGIFSVELDFGAGTFVGDQLWLEIGVREGDSTGGFTGLLPRQALRATPYALHAEMVAIDAIGSSEIANNSVRAADIAADAVGLSEIDTSAVQARITGSCGAGESFISVNANGSVQCGADDWNLNATGIDYQGGQVGIGVTALEADLHLAEDASVLFGGSTTGAGYKFMMLPDVHAVRLGTVASGAASVYWDPENVGEYSFAAGLNTRAQGFGATALGRDTEAEESYAFASGFFSNANGLYSTAMGFNTDAEALGSTALGYSTDAEENYSFAAGYFAEAQAIYSIAIGNAVRAQSFASMAVGRYNVGGGSATSWLSGDPIFEIGIGTGPSSRANAVTVRKNGNVGVGTTVPLDRLHVNGRIRLQTVEYFEDGGTSEIAVRGDLRPSADNTYDIGTSALRYDDVYATSGVVNTSDARAKTDISALSYGLNEILSLAPMAFRYKNDQPKDPMRFGFLAQDVQPLMPEIVKTHNWEVDEETGELFEVELEQMGMYYSALIPVMVRAIQEQQAQIVSLKKEIAARR